ARNIKFRSCSSNYNPKYFSNFSIYTLNDSLYSEVDLIRPLVTGLKANVDFQIRLENSKIYQTLFSYNIDVCSIVISYKDTLFKRWFKSLLKHSNFMQNCPIHEGHYYLNAWRMESSLIPTYLYPGDYRFKGYAYMGKLKNKDNFILELTTDAQRSLKFKFRKYEFRSVESSSSSHFFSNFTSHIINNSLHLDMNTIRIIETGYKAHVDFQIRLKGSKQYQTLFVYTLDVCNMVITIKNSIFKRWFRSFLKYGNFMQNCPVYSGHYYLNGWKLDSDMVPAYLYAGDYRVKGHAYFGKYKSKGEEFVMSMDLDVSLIT
ncbi:hypothetical protein CVS40_6002, partial [Lucilia cuprina]